jgi:Na+-translocating ferredoxin:NAD+ oxidoreductase RnfD subunit
VTLANYELMTSPLLFTAFFLATSTSVRPMAKRARAIYAMSFGALAALFQLYASVAMGPYLALLFAGLLAPTLDKWFRPRALV